LLVILIRVLTTLLAALATALPLLVGLVLPAPALLLPALTRTRRILLLLARILRIWLIRVGHCFLLEG
jgi:hypothetical protein